jgi:hypothetical protein
MVSIIACTIRDEMMENVFDNYANQLCNEKELIIILNNDDMDIEKWREKALNYENVSIFQLPEIKTLGDCLNFGIEKAKFGTIAKFDDDDYYSPYYLTEAIDAFRKYHAQLVGKGSSYMYFEHEKLLAIRKIGNENKLGKSFVKGGTLVFKKNLYPKIKFPSKKGSGEDSIFLKECMRRNIRIYATSRYNYVYIRRGDQLSHTYQRTVNFFKKNCTIIGKTDDYKKMSTKRIGSNL